jgi:hypothetical protein
MLICRIPHSPTSTKRRSLFCSSHRAP